MPPAADRARIDRDSSSEIGRDIWGQTMNLKSIARLGILGAIVVMALAACSASDTSRNHTTPTATATSPQTPTNVGSTATAGSYAVRVFFSKHPDSDNNVATVFPVGRVSPTLGVATYATQQLIAGPTAAEAAQGYYTPLPSSLSGPSNCGGADFQITLDTKGPTPEPGTATLRFCRNTMLAGDLTGAYISAEIKATLTQFPNIHKVVILTSAGSCFDDLSGMNTCLQ